MVICYQYRIIIYNNNNEKNITWILAYCKNVIFNTPFFLNCLADDNRIAVSFQPQISYLLIPFYFKCLVQEKNN